MAEDISKLHQHALLIMEVVAAWRTFKQTHDYESIKIECCEHTKRLHNSLDGLEQMIMKDLKPTERKGPISIIPPKKGGDN